MEDIVYFIALVVTGPMVGVEIGVAAFTNPIIDRLPDDAYRQVRRDGSRLLGRVMPFWYVATLVVLIAAAVVTSGDWAITTSAVLMGLVVLLTVTVLVPINNRVGSWSHTADVDRDLARRWDLGSPSSASDRILPILRGVSCADAVARGGRFG